MEVNGSSHSPKADADRGMAWIHPAIEPHSVTHQRTDCTQAVNINVCTPSETGLSPLHARVCAGALRTYQTQLQHAHR